MPKHVIATDSVVTRASAIFEGVTLPHTTTSSLTYLDWAFDAAYTEHADGGGIISIDGVDPTLIRVSESGMYVARAFLMAGTGGVEGQNYEAAIWFDWDTAVFGDHYFMPGGPSERASAAFTHQMDAGEALAVGVRNGAGVATEIVAAALYVNKIG